MFAKPDEPRHEHPRTKPSSAPPPFRMRLLRLGRLAVFRAGPLDLYARGDLDLTAVKLGFECQSEPLLGRLDDLIDDNGGLWNFHGPHVGAKVVRSLLALDAWA